MTTAKFMVRAGRLVADLNHMHEALVTFADAGLGEETLDTVEAAAGAVGAALRLLELAATRCPAGGVVP
jgi:hypothetical protein